MQPHARNKKAEKKEESWTKPATDGLDDEEKTDVVATKPSNIAVKSSTLLNT